MVIKDIPSPPKARPQLAATIPPIRERHDRYSDVTWDGRALREGRDNSSQNILMVSATSDEDNPFKFSF